MTDQKIDARVPSDTSKTGPHTTGDSGNQAAHARRSAEECFDRGLQYDDAGNHVNALEWYRKAADQGYAVAQVILGWHYHTGEGVPQDDAEAGMTRRRCGGSGWPRTKAMLKRSTDSGRLTAMATAFGRMTRSQCGGFGWPRTKGMLRRSSCSGGCATRAAASYRMRRRRCGGTGWPPTKGMPWRRSSSGGITTLARAFHRMTRRRWYRLAADQGDAVAQQSLGCVYREGKGVPQDDAESVRWFRLAAEQGRADAQHDLACSYRDGNGVPQDYVQAHMWYSLSASQSSEAEWANRAKNRDLTAQRMTPDQLAEAQRLAREWAAAHPREP